MYANEDVVDLDFEGLQILTFDKPIIDRIVSNYTNENDKENSYLEARLNENNDLDIMTTRLFPSYIDHNTNDMITLTVKYACGQIIKSWVSFPN